MTFEDEIMNQIFLQHLPFSLGGLIIGAGLWRFCNTPWAHRIAGSFISLSFIHAGSIIALYLGREEMGESYAYLIYGGILTILICFLAGILLSIWGAIFLVNRKQNNEKRLEQAGPGYPPQGVGSPDP